jgi:hypothetical protein
MPNCFQLIRDGEAVPLVKVDEEMCQHFGAVCDADVYFRAWYNTIGYDLAMGRSFLEIEEIYASPPWEGSGLTEVARWMSANFSSRSWYEPSGHPR